MFSLELIPLIYHLPKELRSVGNVRIRASPMVCSNPIVYERTEFSCVIENTIAPVTNIAEVTSERVALPVPT
jgi:hypothetical protein